MKLVSIFSDGERDVYNGKRAVTAGWRVKTPEGKSMRGHSLDVETARKTAHNNARYLCPVRAFDNPRGSRRMTAAALNYLNREAREAGHRDAQAAYVDYANKLADWRDTCTIEVVTLVRE